MSARRPRVSVIVPMYQASAFLERCAQSVLRQTCADLELLLVDDGSTDDSASVADEIARRDARVRVLRRAHVGPGAARNAGLAEARAPYVTFVDADDVLDATACEAMVAHADATAADLVVAKTDTWRRAPIPRQATGAAAVRALYTGGMSMGIYAKLYRRTFLQKEGVSFPPDTFIEDRTFLLRCIVAGASLTPLDAVVYRRVLRADSAMHRVSGKLIGDATRALRLDAAELERGRLLDECGHYAGWATLMVDVHLAHALEAVPTLRADLASEIDDQLALFVTLSGPRAPWWALMLAARRLRSDVARGRRPVLVRHGLRALRRTFL